MRTMPYLPDRLAAETALDLLSIHGELAGPEAAARADAARDLGNHVHFCRWRQIERMIVLLSITHAVDTVH